MTTSVVDHPEVHDVVAAARRLAPLRDIHVAVQHNSAFPAHYESAGQVLMGLKPSDPGW